MIKRTFVRIYWIQRTAIKITTNLNKLSYNQRLTEFNLITLKYRGVRRDLKQMLKIMKGLEVVHIIAKKTNIKIFRFFWWWNFLGLDQVGPQLFRTESDKKKFRPVDLGSGPVQKNSSLKKRILQQKILKNY